MRSSPWCLEGSFTAYTISTGNRGSRCTSPWGRRVCVPCHGADLGSCTDAAEIGVSVLELTILRAPTIVPIRKAMGMMLLFALRETLWKWTKSESWEAQAARMMCISLVYAGASWKKPVLLLEKMAFASCHSLPLVLWAVPSFALVSFLQKLLPLPSSHFLRSTRNQRMWSGHPVYNPAPTREERASVYL